ncbi:MAG TPA: TonB-dependent receptor [Candidatus Acidoferrales bacterium]|nr:TonB-dependent receptor [Candidatus Acidoferrales bacterium]
MIIRSLHSLRARVVVSLAVACFALMTVPSLIYGQTVTGTILGNILDSSGAAVPNAQITITNQDTGVVRETASTTDGVYNVPSLLPGKYTVQAKASGFTPGGVKDVVVNVGSDTRVDVTLQVGQVTQQVTVSEAVPTIETTSSEVAQVMDEQIIQNIPLNARDLQQLSVIQPGVQQTYTSSFGKQVSVGGDRVANNRFLQEGIDLTWTFRTSPVSLASNILMGADAVKEFKVIAENPPVEYGELSGGITSTTFKSGTNNIHGTVFEYYRNNTFDARNFFDAGGTPPLHRHQFGGQVGGPIQKDKTFYFADFEALRSDAAQSFTAAVPDLAARNSAVPAIQQIFFGATPSSGIGANVPLMPACNDGGYNKAAVGLCNFNSNPIQAVREYYGVAKIDHSFGSKNTLSSSYNIDQSNEFEPTQLDVTADDVYMRRQVWTIQDTHIVSANVVNTFRFGIHRINYAGNLDLVTPAPVDPRLYVNVNPNIVNRSPFPQVPALTFGFGGQALGSPALGFNYVPRFIGYTNGSISDDLNYLHGNHAFQFGFQAKKWYDNIENYMSTPRGNYTFGTLQQFLNGGPATAFTWWVQNYTDPVNGQHYDSNFARGVRLMSYGIYAEDTYKVKSNLTVTYGLRWEYATAPAEEHNRISNLYAQDGSCNPFTCTAPQVGAPWYHPPKDNFAPRVGFNWDPFKKGKTSVRGGAGIMFAEMEDDYWYPTLASQPPFTVAVSLPGQVSLPFNNVLPNGTPTPNGVGGTSNSALNTFLAGNPNIFTRETYGGAEFPHFKTPTKYAFNLTIQQELPDHITLLVGYVGSQARHQGRTYNYSDYFPTTIETPGQLPAVNGVPIPGSVVNPSCVTPGGIDCYYWAGSLSAAGLGASNANVLAVGTAPTLAQCALSPSVPCDYNHFFAPYATDCAGGAVKPPCYNNPNWGNSITGNITDGNAYYNALQTVVMRRMSPGLFARFNYTFAKCIADSGDNLPGQYTNGGSAGFPLIYSHSAGRGRCAYLGTNSANLTLTYETPWGKNATSFLVKNVLSNWEITTQTLVSSGVPFTVSAGDDVARYTTVGGAGADRPDWAAPSAACPDPSPNGAINKHNPVNYVNQACFALAPPGYLGNVGPLMFTGPNTINTDISLRKTIPMKREGMSFVVSADMFNAFNRTNFSAPTVLNAFTTSGLPNGTLGAINTNNPYATVTTSRQFQINGRFVF